MDNLIIYNSSTSGSNILSFAAEHFWATSQLYVYMLQLLSLFIIPLVISLYNRGKSRRSSLVDYGGKQMADTMQSSNIWDEKAIQKSLQELGQKLEDMVLMPDLF